jgi:hypothetical protein
MTQDLLVDLGEEYCIKNGLDAITVSVGLYNDATDALSDPSDVGDITTEPSNANYAQASVTFSAYDNASANWAVDNDTKFTFDFSDQTTSEDVDTAVITYDFQAEDTSDTTITTHLIANPALSQTRDIGSIDTLEIAAGDLEIALN